VLSVELFRRAKHGGKRAGITRPWIGAEHAHQVDAISLLGQRISGPRHGHRGDAARTRS